MNKLDKAAMRVVEAAEDFMAQDWFWEQFGKTTETSLPGEYDTLVSALRKYHYLKRMSDERSK